jgi:hypothetical protein
VPVFCIVYVYSREILHKKFNSLATVNCKEPTLRLFWAHLALASLVPFQGPKKSRFSGPTPTNAPRNDVALLKTITYRAIKTTGTLIVIKLAKTQESGYTEVVM